MHYGVTGYLFEPGKAADLADKARLLWYNVGDCFPMGRNARKEYEERYTPERNYEMLMNIYDEVMERRR